METHLTCILYSVHENLTAIVIFMYTTSSRTALYLQKVHLMETHHRWENAHIVLMQIFEYSHENLSPIGLKPSVWSWEQ
jgi:hypothetical protein